MAKRFPYYANMATEILHKSSKRDDACRASEILPKNKKGFEKPSQAIKQGLRLCKNCFKDPDNEF